MRIALIIITSLTLSIGASAQRFHEQDSTRRNPIFQIGMGGYFGTHMCLPKSSGYSYYNSAGYDQGLFLKAIFNITSSLSISSDLRYTFWSSNIGLQNDAIINKFNVNASGFQEQLTLNYTFKNWMGKDLFGISTGMAFNQTKFKYSNVYWGTFQPYYDPIKIGGLDDQKDDPLYYFSWIFALSKQIRLHDRCSLVVFNEYELQLNAFATQNSIYNLQTHTTQTYTTHFKSFSARLGTYYIF
jgi:hypothetical protein